MTDPHVAGYGLRIADALAHDGVPARLPEAEARAIADRYGVYEFLPFEDGPVTRKEISEYIAGALLR